LAKKHRTYHSFREHKEDLYGEIRSLKKQIKSLTKEISRLRKYEEFFMQDVDFIKKNKQKKQERKNKKKIAELLSKDKPDLDQGLNCGNCNTFNVILIEVLNRKYLECKECGHRKKIIHEAENE
jgi:hypothetical protein